MLTGGGGRDGFACDAGGGGKLPVWDPGTGGSGSPGIDDVDVRATMGGSGARDGGGGSGICDVATGGGVAEKRAGCPTGAAGIGGNDDAERDVTGDHDEGAGAGGRVPPLSGGNPTGDGGVCAGAAMAIDGGGGGGGAAWPNGDGESVIGRSGIGGAEVTTDGGGGGGGADPEKRGGGGGTGPLRLCCEGA